MTLLIDLVLLVAGLVLWHRGSTEGDDVWSMFLRALAVIDLVVIALSNGVLWIEVPLLIGAATPGKEILHPVAVTIFGGLVSATALDAFVTPLLLFWFGRKAIERLRSAAAHEPAGSHTAAHSY